MGRGRISKKKSFVKYTRNRASNKLNFVFATQRALNNCFCIVECNAVWFEGGSGDRCPLDSHRDRERPTPPSAVLQGNDRWCKACRCINASLHLHEAAAISGPPTTPRDTHLSFPENLWSLCFWRILLRLTTIAEPNVSSSLLYARSLCSWESLIPIHFQLFLKQKL